MPWKLHLNSPTPFEDTQGVPKSSIIHLPCKSVRRRSRGYVVAAGQGHCVNFI